MGWLSIVCTARKREAWGPGWILLWPRQKVLIEIKFDVVGPVFVYFVALRLLYDMQWFSLVALALVGPATAMLRFSCSQLVIDRIDP
jgi:hypothetical protein